MTAVPLPFPNGHTIGCGIFNGQKMHTTEELRAYGDARAAEAATQEREACALIAEGWATDETATTCDNIAKAIRAVKRARETP